MSQLLDQVLHGTTLELTQQYMVLRAKVSLNHDEFTASIYTSDRVVIQASAKVSQRTVDRVAEALALLADESVIHASERESPHIIRSRQLKEYMATLGEGEIDNLVAVLLADLIIELVVTERLSDYVKDRRLLESESLPPKLKALSDKLSSQKGQQPVYVYKYREILDLRGLRNKVAHGVQPMTAEEVKWAREIALDVFELL